MAPRRSRCSVGSCWAMTERPSRMTDRWDGAEPYEAYIGRWSRPVAREFLDWLAVPPGAAWLDVGCGTGALSASVLGLAAPRSIVGIDHSGAYVEHARRAVSDPRASFHEGDAQQLAFPDATFDASISGLVLNFVPEPARAAAEMVRVTRPGGVVAAYLWDLAGEMQLIRRFWEAAIAEDPAAAELDEGRRFPTASQERLRALFTSAGLPSIEERPIDVPTVFRDFDDYWRPFLGGQGPAPGYVLSLSETARARLRERLRRTLPTQPDGSIHLIARAWAVRART